MQPRKMATLAREAALDKQAVDPLVLDVSKLTSIAHYFLIASGNSDVHTRAIANHILATMKAQKVELYHKEGMESSQWIVLDYGSLLIHLFYRELREFYSLERLWGEAKILS